MRHDDVANRRAGLILHARAIAGALRREAGALARRRAFLILMILIAGIAGTLGGLDLAYRYAALDGGALPDALFLSEEGGLGECFEYALTFLSALVMARRWLARRIAMDAVAAALFLWLTLDNALQVHERVGETLGTPGSILEAVDELMVFGAVGAILLAAILAALRREAAFRAAPALLVILIAMLAAPFGMAVDFAHSLLSSGSDTIDFTLGFIEDFGELAALALAAAAALSLPFRGTAPPN